MKTSSIIQRSMGWSLFTEIAAKFVTPVTNMLLARLLTPDDFGVLAVCNMLISFVDIITDAGFGKYLIQHDFLNNEERNKYANVAFWSNLALSLIIFLGILLNRTKIAEMLGKAEYDTVISVAAFQLLFTSMSSIQTGLFRREFKFKKLFWARIAVAITPLMISVPAALITHSYWALVVGNLSAAVINSVLLTIFSDWKPSFFYSFNIFKEMFGFSIWSLCEGLANWMIFWIDTFLITSAYSEYYIGLYKNSANMVGSVINMISAAAGPVLLSVLSRVKNDAKTYKNMFFSIQRIMMYLVIPMGVGLFCYRNVATHILFGDQWTEAANIVGAWALMMTCSVVFYSLTAEIYKSKGKPQVLFAFQCSYLVFLIPMCIWGIHQGFWEFVYIRCLCVFEQVVMSVIFLWIFLKIHPGYLLKNMLKPIVASMSIVVTFLLLRGFMDTYVKEFIGLLISGCAYLGVVFIFFKKDLLQAKDMIQEF